MAENRLKVQMHPVMKGPRMILGFSGWMDGGEVSTGTIRYLIQKLGAGVLAEIDSEDFCIFSFPGSMELSSLFRPHTKIEDGLISDYQGPRNTFFCSEPDNLILFLGKEPNLRWSEYAECVFSLASQFGVSMIYFIGSLGGLLPHTRDPRLFSSVSDESLKEMLQRFDVRFSNYEGPAGISTYLTHVAAKKAIGMVNLVAEIPSYVQGRNPRSIEAVTRRLAAILNLQIDLDDLRTQAEHLEERLNQIIEQRPELADRIKSLEEDYDSEVFDTQMGDLRDWLQQQSIRLD